MTSATDVTVACEVLNSRNTLSEHGSASVATMERTMWTDERLDDRFDGLDRTLERIDRDLRDLRQLIFQLWGATLITQLAVIATIIVTNT